MRGPNIVIHVALERESNLSLCFATSNANITIHSDLLCLRLGRVIL
jgi:hypothetical protein